MGGKEVSFTVTPEHKFVGNKGKTQGREWVKNHRQRHLISGWLQIWEN